MDSTFRSFSLSRSAPEAQGVSSEGLLALIEALSSSIHDMHSIIIMRNGYVTAEGSWSPYTPSRPHMLYSLSKSFASTAAGIAIQEGAFSLDDTVLSFFPEEAPAFPDENLLRMQVRHLLSMSTGHDKDTTGYMRENESWVRAFLQRPVEHTPGTHFVYNSGATYMVSAIVQKTTGYKVVEYLRPRLFDPLGIGGVTWENCPLGINTGGWGLNVKIEDIAKFGQLYLQKGQWAGTQLLSDRWVEQATSSQVSNGNDPDNDWNQGYGFQFWRCRYNAYRGDGAFGQFCVVMPDQQAVVAITAGTGDMPGILKLLWEYLLPAFAPGPLLENPAAEAKLASVLQGLALPIPQGAAASPKAAAISGKLYTFEANEQKFETIRFIFDGTGSAVHIGRFGQQHSLALGSAGQWAMGETTLESSLQPVAASGAWRSEEEYDSRIYFVETPWYYTLNFRFEGDRLLMDYRQSVSFGPTERPLLTAVCSDGPG